MKEAIVAAYGKGLKLLARREHSRYELARKLINRHYPKAAVAVALDRLEAEDALSDRRFAVAYAQARFAKGFGPRRVTAELAEHGIKGEDLSLAHLDRETEAELAAAQLRRHFGSGVPADSGEQAKQLRYLQHRGFDPEVCTEVIRGNLQEEPDF